MSLFEERIEGFSVEEKRAEFRNLVKGNPEVLENYHKNILTEEDVIEIVRDVSLSDRQCLKILAKIRQKWGRQLIMANIKKALFEMKRKLDVLFTLELLDKEDSLCFQDSSGTPITRYLVYCNDLGKV